MKDLKIEKKNLKDIETGKDHLRLESAKNRQIALQQLETAKMLERTRNKKGFVWVSKGKISKHIHPSKVKAHLADEWKLTKIKKK